MGDDHDAQSRGMRAIEKARKADKKYGISDLRNTAKIRSDMLEKCLVIIDGYEVFSAADQPEVIIEFLEEVRKEIKEN